MNKESPYLGRIKAEPTQWCESSKQSVAFQFNFITYYEAIEYNCRYCGKAAIFSAEEQKYTYEVKKSPIDQRRVLCPVCFENFAKLKNSITSMQSQWAESKNVLKSDTVFLSNWLNSLLEYEKYKPYKGNTAIKNMLKKLLNENA